MIFKNVPKGHTADPFEAFRQLVYQFGVPALAQQMGLKPGTLWNKADADADTHHQPTMRDVMLATRLTNDMRVLDAMNEQFGRVAFDTRAMGVTSDEALLELLTRLGDESGQFHAALRNALVDRRFSMRELSAVRAEAFDMVSALMTLLVRMEGLLDE